MLNSLQDGELTHHSLQLLEPTITFLLTQLIKIQEVKLLNSLQNKELDKGVIEHINVSTDSKGHC